MTTLTFHGAAGTVTGSRFLLETGQSRILVDCGLFQGLKELRLRNWDGRFDAMANVDAIVLTHAHIDHSGYLPRLVQAGYRGPIYATPPTIDLLGLLLPDAAYLQEEEAAYANKHGFSKHKPALPLFTMEDAIATLRLTRPLEYGKRSRIRSDVTAVLRDAGHLLGAASVDMVAGGCHVVFSGDLGRYGSALLNDPVTVESADVVVCESTYGDRLHSGDALDDLTDAIDEARQRRGVLLIPAFALGRTQELLHAMSRLAEQNRLPDWPVYVDSPMAIDATTIFSRYPSYHRLDLERSRRAFRPSELHFARTQTDSRRLNDLERNTIIISASGMATGGRVLHHLRRLLPGERNVVFFAGFQAPGTRGRSLVDGAETVRMFGEEIPVRADVRHSQAFSAHGDQRDILRWLSGFKRPPRATYLVHGEPEASATLAEVVRQQLGWSVAPAVDGETVDLAAARAVRGRSRGEASRSRSGRPREASREYE